MNEKLKSLTAITGVLAMALMLVVSGTALASSTVLWDSQNQSGNLNAVYDDTNSSGVSFTDSDGFAELSEGDNYTSQIITLGESPGEMSVTYDAGSADQGATVTLYDSSDNEIASSDELTGMGEESVYFETDATEVYFEVTFPEDSDGSAETFTVENVTFETGQGAVNVDPVDVNGDSLSPESIEYTLTDTDGNVVEEGTTSSSESPPYVIGTGIEAGDYTLDLSVSGYQDVSRDVSVPTDGSLNTVTATFEEPATGTLSIDTVTDQDSNTIDTVEYDVVDPNDGSIVVEGSETIPVSEEVETGTYDVTVTADGYDSVTKSVDITENATTSPSFSLTASTDSVTTGSAEITAQDIDGNAIEGATVELVDSSDTVVNTVDTDADGLAAFSDVETGDYTYNVSANDYQDVNGTSITVSDNSTVTDTTQLEPTRSIEFTVQDADGNALEGATVELTDSSGSVVDSATTDADGLATLTGVSDGTQSVSVSATDYQDASTEIDVQDDGSVTADMVLSDNVDETNGVTSTLSYSESTDDSTGGAGFVGDMDLIPVIVVGGSIITIISFFLAIKD